MSRLALLALPLVAGCAVATSSRGGAPPSLGGGSRADDWITIRDFRWVQAVAVSERVAYFGTTAGLERWDTLREMWRAPLTAADGLPDDRVTALAAEPLEGDLWIGTVRGLARVAGHDDFVEPVWGPPPAPVDMILFDPREGIAYARVVGTWWAGRGASFERVASPPRGGLEGSTRAVDLDPAQVPWIDPLYVRGSASGGLFRLTQVDRDSRGDWYAGTWGDNARRWSTGRGDWEPLMFGLAGAGGGPIVRANDGYWFLPGSETGESPALAHASPDLAAWSYVVPREEPALPSAAAHAALGLGDTLMVGSDFGIAWGVGPGWQGAGRDMEPGPVFALAADGPVVWVGTDTGLVVWSRAERAVAASALERRRVRAIAVAPDALFVGTDEGLWVGRRAGPPAEPGEAAALADSLVRVAPRGRGVRDLALHQGLVIVASDVGLEVFDRASGTWRVLGVGEGRLDASPLAVASDGENVWVGTDRGLARWRPATDEWRAYGTGDGLAGAPVRRLLAERDALWASTPAGISRYAWRRAEP